MKSIKVNGIFISACYIVAGILFFLYPSTTQEQLCMWLAYASLAIGSIEIIAYFVRPKEEAFFKNDFILGLLLITFGVIIVINPKAYAGLIYTAIAVIIMLSGYNKLQDSVDAWRLGKGNGVLYLFLAVISIATGIIIIVHGPKMTTETLDYVICGGLLYSGITDLISAISLSIKMAMHIHNKKKQEEKMQAEVKNDEPELIEEETSTEVVDEEVEKAQIEEDDNNPEA